MIRRVLGFLFFSAVALALVYGSYRMLKSEAPKAAVSDKAKKEEQSDSVILSNAKVSVAGIELAKASSGILQDSFRLNGIVQPNQESLVQVTPRFPGIVRDVRKRIGDVIQKGDVLAIIESNQSLTQYEMKASLAGTVIDRQISLGEFVSEQKSAFVVADLSNVWVDFSVYRRDLKRVGIGNQVLIDPADGGPTIDAQVSYLSPVGSSDTQSAIARAIVPNASRRLRPGLFVTGQLTLSAKKVGIAVKSSALQTFENRTVVFVRNGDKFDARDVEIGDRDSRLVEITFGVLEGDVYAAQNSFIVKAEMGKGSGDND